MAPECAYLEIANFNPKPIRKTPAALFRKLEILGLARMRSAKKVVSITELKPYNNVSSAMVASIAANVVMPWWVFGFTNSGKKAM